MIRRGLEQTVLRKHDALPEAITRLIEVGRAEGFGFVDRLVREWESGENRFAAPGEVFVCAYAGIDLVGFGGLNADPYGGDAFTGRIRHVFVDPAARGRGVGSLVVLELVRAARPHFRRLRLRTRQAAPFYEQLGFARVAEPDATHAIDVAS